MEVFLGFHLVICFCCLALWHGRSRGQRVCRFMILLFLPGAGVLYWGILDLMEKLQPLSPKDGVPGGELPDSVPGAGLLAKIDVWKEINIVPMEEALLLNQNAIKRRLLIDMLKKEGEPDIPLLRVALQNEDSETSHYAAAAMVDMKGRLLQELGDLPEECNLAGMDPDRLKAYIEPLHRYMDSGFQNETGGGKWRELYRSMLDVLLQQGRQDETYYVERIRQDLEIRDFSSAQRYCIRYMNDYPDREGPYWMSLNLYYEARNSEGFFTTLERLGNSRVRVTGSLRNAILLWMEVGT